MARQKIMTEQLPPTPCTPEMREKVVKVADKRGVSMADIMRDAITLFLLENDGLTNHFIGNTDKEPA
jgi:hypothetical protein